jgi:predicted PurR-regulated permease PerM
MNPTLKYVSGIAVTLIGLFFAWYFSDILVYVLIAGVLSFIGQPVVRLFDKIQLRQFKMPHTLSSVLALLVLVSIFVSLFLVFVPVINRQAEVISSIDFEYLGSQIQKPLHDLEKQLLRFNILENDQTLEAMITSELESVMNMTSVKSIFGNVVGFAGSLFIGIFSVIFLSFFFLRDDKLFYDGIMLFVPTKLESKAAIIMSDTRRLLSRYFVGLVVEIFAMMIMITLGLTLFGVNNALFIGFIGGMMNVIPYLGPIIGGVLGVLIAATGTLSTGTYEDIVPISVIIVVTFVITKLIDDFLLQPLILSRSVKAHPIEIFLVILMAGSLAGIPGMILAIPAYTVIRIIAKQFFNQSKLVQKITENI